MSTCCPLAQKIPGVAASDVLIFRLKVQSQLKQVQRITGRIETVLPIHVFVRDAFVRNLNSMCVGEKVFE